MFAVGGSPGIPLHRRRRDNKSIARHARPAECDTNGPVWGGAVRNFDSALVKQKDPHVLRRLNTLKILLDLLLAALFVGADRVIENVGAQGLPGRTAGAQRESYKNGRDQKDRNRHPEGKKDSKE